MDYLCTITVGTDYPSHVCILKLRSSSIRLRGNVPGKHDLVKGEAELKKISHNSGMISHGALELGCPFRTVLP